MTHPVNPYIAGAPLRGERGFFGRQDTLEWVQRELGNPATNALVLFGQRRIGKTSLLLQLQRTLEGPAYLPIYFDLQDQATRPLNQVLYDLTDTIADKLGLERPISGNFDPRGVFFRKVVLSQVHHLLGENRRLVLLMDEFDVLDQAAQAELPEYAAAKGFFPFLRRIMTDDARPAFVFVVGRRAEDLALNFTATFKASLVREIWTLDPDSAAALVRQAESNGTLDFTDEAIARILNLTNSHPYLTQLLCQRIWERAYAAHPATPPVIDVLQAESIVADALQAGNQALTWLWTGLSPAERIFAAALAENIAEGGVIKVDDIVQVLSANAERLITREVEAARGDLVKRHVLNEVSSGEYRFAVELFRRWVRQHRPLRDVKDELDRVNPEADQLFNFGHRYFRRREWAYAERYFRDALRENPKHFRARLFLGEVLLELNKKDEAVTELQQAYDLDRDEARLPLARGLRELTLAREQAGDDDGALLAIDRALQILPTEQSAKDVRARLWAKRGDTALAQDDLEKALAAYHEAGLTERVAHVEALQKRKALNAIETRATTQALNKNWRDAANAYDQLVAQAPDDKSRNQWASARALAVEEQELQDLFEEGLEAYNAKQWLDAQKALAEVVKRRPSYARNDQPATRLLKRVETELDRPRRLRQIYLTARKWVGVALVGVMLITLMMVVPTLLPNIKPTETLPAETAIAARTLSAEPPTTAVVATDTPSPTNTPKITDTPTKTATLTATPEPTPTMSSALEGTAIPTPAEGISFDTVSRLTQLALWGNGAIRQVAYSPDGAWLAVGTTIGVYILDANTEAEARFLETGFVVTTFSFSPDSDLLAVASSASTVIQLWRVADGTLLDELRGHSAGITSVAFSPDRIRLASASEDGTVIFWDADKRGPIGEPLTLGTITRLVFAPKDGAILALGADDGTLQLWDVVKGAVLGAFPAGQGGRVTALAFAPEDASFLASAGGDSVILWDISNPKNIFHPFGPFAVPDQPAASVAFSASGDLLLFSSYSEVQARRVKDGAEAWRLASDTGFEQGGTIYLATSPKTSVFLAASEDGQMVVRQADADGQVLRTAKPFSTEGVALAVSADGRIAVATFNNGQTRVWRVGAGKIIQTLSYGARVLAVSSDGQFFATGAGTEVKVWAVGSGEPRWVQTKHTGSVVSLAFSHDGRLLASGSNDNTVRLWDVDSGEDMGELGEDASPMLSLAFAPDDSRLVAGSQEGAVWLWRLSDNALERVLTGKNPLPPLSGVTFSPDGTEVSAMDDDGGLHRWEAETGVELSTLALGEPYLQAVAFFPEENLLAVGLSDNSIGIWNMLDGSRLATLTGHTASVRSLAFTAKGDVLISTSTDGTVRLWAVRP